ncbi:dihydrofolate reductase family protein [Nocardioides sp. AX2bis]|uniref:dihydrofolate reductase family protein n=1 Tax=Nocardioides sp. AX2bis TaxID=2653157 RepID=UPI0012F162FE|nr:dihydrofolate reductase family protein [Nocardioides sp. AX2bis]VXB67623.1 Pyrimidine reductase, riboflavin biosynthesis [Nocardioides sp. AX2bis]
MRLILGPDAPRPVTPDDLPDLYARPADAGDGPWVRACMISSLDGAATGPDGLSGGLNNEPDHAVFGALRGLADAVLVGAGTARDEGYGPADVPLVLISRQGEVPEGLRDADPGRVMMVVPASAAHLGEAEGILGPEHVWVLGEDEIDFAALRDRMAAQGWREVTCEGGPSTLGVLLGAGLIDEVAATVVPRLMAGEHPRMTAGPDVDVDLELMSLLDEDGTLLGRWRVRR